MAAVCACALLWLVGMPLFAVRRQSLGQHKTLRDNSVGDRHSIGCERHTDGTHFNIGCGAITALNSMHYDELDLWLRWCMNMLLDLFLDSQGSGWSESKEGSSLAVVAEDMRKFERRRYLGSACSSSQRVYMQHKLNFALAGWYVLACACC